MIDPNEIEIPSIRISTSEKCKRKEDNCERRSCVQLHRTPDYHISSTDEDERTFIKCEHVFILRSAFLVTLRTD